jgi:hypothetical protein
MKVSLQEVTRSRRAFRGDAGVGFYCSLEAYSVDVHFHCSPVKVGCMHIHYAEGT